MSNATAVQPKPIPREEIDDEVSLSTLLLERTDVLVTIEGAIWRFQSINNTLKVTELVPARHVISKEHPTGQVTVRGRIHAVHALQSGSHVFLYNLHGEELSEYHGCVGMAYDSTINMEKGNQVKLTGQEEW